MRILFLSRWFPFPPCNGSKLRIYNLLRGLSQHHDITLISFYEEFEGEPAIGQLSDYCKKILFIPRRPFNTISSRSLMGFFSRTPRSVIDTFSTQMAQTISDEISSNPYDSVIASQFDMAVYAEYFHSLPAIFEEAEVGVIYDKYSLAQSPLHHFRYGMTWKKHRDYLNSLVKYFYACTVVSDQEYLLLKSALTDHDIVEVIPNFLNLDDYQRVDLPKQNQLVFTGSFSYFPNYEAMYWFVSEVYPKITAQVPGVQLIITGDPAGQTLPADDRVIHVGLVQDVRPYISSASCSIVPIHMGGGTRLKILEAMALGTPVVSTSKGAEGLEVQDGTHLLIADEPESFANVVVRLLQDNSLRRSISENARKLMEDRYSSDVIIPKYLALIEKLVISENKVC